MEPTGVERHGRSPHAERSTAIASLTRKGLLKAAAVLARANFIEVLLASHRDVHITLSLLCGEQKRQNPPPVEYWKTALSIFAALSASLTLADDFRTIRGKEYKDATVSRVEPDGIVLRTKSGIVKLYFSELPKEVQGRFDHEGAETTASATPHLTPMNEVKPSRLVAALEKLQRRGLLRIDCSEPDAKAWIVPAVWKRFDAQEKENMTKNLAAYCHPQHPSIWILDKQSGRKLASYDPFRGFEATRL